MFGKSILTLTVISVLLLVTHAHAFNWFGLGSVGSTGSTSAGTFQDHGGEGVSAYSRVMVHPFVFTDHTQFQAWGDRAHSGMHHEADEYVTSVLWRYEHRSYYKHSYTLLFTNKGNLYVTEKNDLGVLWYRYVSEID